MVDKRELMYYIQENGSIDVIRLYSLFESRSDAQTAITRLQHDGWVVKDSQGAYILTAEGKEQLFEDSPNQCTTKNKHQWAELCHKLDKIIELLNGR